MTAGVPWDDLHSKLPLPVKQKLRRVAAGTGDTMTGVLVQLILALPEPVRRETASPPSHSPPPAALQDPTEAADKLTSPRLSTDPLPVAHCPLPPPAPPSSPPFSQSPAQVAYDRWLEETGAADPWKEIDAARQRMREQPSLFEAPPRPVAGDPEFHGGVRGRAAREARRRAEAAQAKVLARRHPPSAFAPDLPLPSQASAARGRSLSDDEIRRAYPGVPLSRRKPGDNAGGG